MRVRGRFPLGARAPTKVRPVDSKTLAHCEQVLEYKFNDPALLALALTHSSVAPTRVQSNERLEFLGDSVLGLVVCSDLYQQNADLLEGEMTRIKSAVVSRQVCALVAESAGIAQLMDLGKGMSLPAGLPQSVSAAVLESIIGAIYVDGGLEPARTFILRHMSPYIASALANEQLHNYKSILQQLAQRLWGATPEYQMLDEKGPDHSKCFEIAVSIDGRQFPSAWGKSKKEAEQKAAMAALEEIQASGVASDIVTDTLR